MGGKIRRQEIYTPTLQNGVLLHHNPIAAPMRKPGRGGCLIAAASRFFYNVGIHADFRRGKYDDKGFIPASHRFISNLQLFAYFTNQLMSWQLSPRLILLIICHSMLAVSTTIDRKVYLTPYTCRLPFRPMPSFCSHVYHIILAKHYCIESNARYSSKHSPCSVISLAASRPT